jgi:hypothetical protein
MTTLLEQKARNHALLRERLKEAYGLEDDDQALRDTLEGESDFKELCLFAAREAKRRERYAEALALIIDDNEIRKARHSMAAKRIREALAAAMDEAGEKKLEGPDITLIMKRGTPHVVPCGDVPQEYMRVKVEANIDKAKIAAELKDGKTLPFAYLSNPAPVLDIRTK